MHPITRIVAVLAALILAPAALAQDENIIRPISRAHMHEYARLLDLDDEQTQVAEMLYEGYMQAIQRENVRMREASEQMQEFWESGDFADFDAEAMRKAQEKMAEASIHHIKSSLRLQDQLFSDMQAVLSEDQVAAFPRVERMRRRQMLLDEIGMEFPWTGVDLVDVLASAELSGGLSDDIKPEIIQYELAIDRELVKILDFMMEMIEKGPEMMYSMEENMEEAEKMMDRVFGWMRAVRSVNKRYARRLGAMLQAEDRMRFEIETRRRAFPEVYANNGAGEAIAAASGFADLSADQPAKIEALAVQFDREFATANEAWASALDAEADDMDMQTMMMSFMNGNSESAKAEKARGELNKRFRQRLEAILTPDQVQRLPDPPMTRREQIEAEFRKQREMQAELEEAG